MTFDLEYNSERPLMIIPEYGRHIQKLVDHCVAQESNNLTFEIFQILNTNYGISCISWQILN
jgi:hypothetical protein